MPQTPPEMTSRRPYLLRALYEWILDNNCSPYLLVDATVSDVVVPKQHIKDGKIVLNLSPSAVRGLEISDDFVSFSARFNGAAMQLMVPLEAVLALYASENGEGMVFGSPAQMSSSSDNSEGAPKPSVPTTGPSLGLIRNSGGEKTGPSLVVATNGNRDASSTSDDGDKSPDDDGPGGGPGGAGKKAGKPGARPSLRVVK